jgi:hypothetical protein
MCGKSLCFCANRVDDEIGRTCCMTGRKKSRYLVLLQKAEERRCLEYLGLRKRIILKWKFKKYHERLWSEDVWLKTRTSNMNCLGNGAFNTSLKYIWTFSSFLLVIYTQTFRRSLPSSSEGNDLRKVVHVKKYYDKEKVQIYFSNVTGTSVIDYCTKLSDFLKAWKFINRMSNA